jgi:hypothetical protein
MKSAYPLELTYDSLPVAPGNAFPAKSEGNGSNFFAFASESAKLIEKMMRSYFYGNYAWISPVFRQL